MRHLKIWLVTGAVLLAVASDAPAQTPAPCQGRDCVEQKWNALRAAAEARLRQSAVPASAPEQARLQAKVRAAREQATRQSSIIAGVDAVEPDDSTAAATVRRLAGAIKANPEGTEAGLVIAPFVLAGSDQAQGLEVTFAALKSDMTRLGVSYTHDATPKLPGVWKDPPACPVEPSVKALDAPKAFYLSACAGVIAALPEKVTSPGIPAAVAARFETQVRQGRLACGLPVSPVSTAAVSTLAEAIAFVRRAVEVTNEVAAITTGVVARDQAVYALVLAPTAPTEGWGPAVETSCYSDEFVRGYFTQLYWNQRIRKVAGSISFDLFPRKFGFSPDDAKLPEGEVKSREARLDFSTARGATEFGVGIGAGQSRDALTDELRGYIGPSFSVAHAFPLLTREPLADSAGTLRLVDGELPPRMVLGLSTAIQLATNKRESQNTAVNSVKVQPHLDFLINDKLSFRLGIPLAAEIVVRKKQDAQPETATSAAKPEVPEKRDLQWTVPVAIVAVIKL